jgi:hypothetical protein
MVAAWSSWLGHRLVWSSSPAALHPFPPSFAAAGVPQSMCGTENGDTPRCSCYEGFTSLPSKLDILTSEPAVDKNMDDGILRHHRGGPVLLFHGRSHQVERVQRLSPRSYHRWGDVGSHSPHAIHTPLRSPTLMSAIFSSCLARLRMLLSFLLPACHFA